MKGKVILVGAGPGDPELLTLKALKAIQSADVVIHDRLVSAEIMALVPQKTEKIFAGKSCKDKAMTQEEINALLIKLSGEGKNVVRLKGGDPILFGRGGEEAQMLLENGIPFEIIPGITSAQGCAAIAGIPLTHRGLATGVRFFTGHRMTKEEAAGELELDWKGLADPDTTLVVYMGLANLAIICQKLIEHGLPSDFPAAAIQQGTMPGQRILRADLASLSQKVVDMEFVPPTLVIIGKVAGLLEKPISAA